VSLNGVLQAAAIVTIVFSVVTSLPIDHPAVQLFTHFRAQYLAVALLLAAVLAASRSPAYASLMLATAILNAAWVLPWYFGGRAEGGPGQSLKLLHANVLSSNREHERFIRLVHEEKPDLVVVQEVSNQWAHALEALQDDYPYRVVEPRRGNFGIALLSRFALVSSSVVASPPLSYPTLVAQIDVGGRTLTVVTTHPTIPVKRPMFESRNEQLASIPGVVTGAPGPVVLVGDLNTSLWDLHYRKLEADTGLVNARRGFGLRPTWPTFLPVAMIPIDHALVSRDIRVVDLRSGPRIGSDHLPLIMTFQP